MSEREHKPTRRDVASPSVVCVDHAHGLLALELIVVIALISILAAMAMPNFGSYGGTTLSSQVQAVADTVRRAQSLAVSRQSLTRVTVSAGANGSLSIAVCNTVSNCTLHSTYTLSQSVALGTAAAVYFNSLGTPVDGSGIPLASAAAFAVSFAGASVNVNVAALTGRVSIES